MTGRLSSTSRAFHAAYEAEIETWKARAAALESLIDRWLVDANIRYHLVRAREKGTASLLAKLREKGYVDPEKQATDLVAARIICYFDGDVNSVVSLLDEKLDVQSLEWNVKGLGVTEFGYRSAHILARLRDPDVLGTLDGMREVIFEVQVRTVLGHAWAEIEHDEVYKSGVAFPDVVNRDLAAIAGMLEFLDRQFELLRLQRDRLTSKYRAAYEEGSEGGVTLDTARMVALLEVIRPAGRGWRSLSVGAGVFPPGIDAIVLKAIRAAGIDTANALRVATATPAFDKAIDTLASATGASPDEVSHLAVAIIAVGVTDPGVLDDYPELIDDPDVRDALLSKA